MRKLVLLLALIWYGALYTQCTEPIITNFECSPPSYTVIGALTTIANPFSSGINTSTNVGQFIDDGTAAFDHLNLNKGSAIDFTTNNILKFKVYSTKLVPLTAKLEGGTSPAIERNLTIDVTGSWVEYTIDFSSESAADHQSLIFFFNFAKTDGTVTDTYYIDDIRWETATTSSDPIVADFESTKPIHGAYPLDGNTLKLSTVSNHISSGINTSATIGKYKDDGTNGFDGLIFEYGSAINLATNNVLKIKLYTSTSIQVLAKLEGGSTAREIWSPFSIDKGPVNSWIEFTYDFSTYSNNASGGDANTRIVLFVNAGVTSGTSSDIYYLDDIKWAPKSTWTGALSSDWSNGGNWTGGVPTATSQVEIPDLTTDPIIGASTGALADNINTNDVLTIASGGSLIVGGTATGNVTYNTNVNDTNWHLLSSPVEGEGYDSTWIANNLIDDTTSAGTNIGIATYSNATDADGDWIYATDAANSGSFNTGQGYSIKRDAIGSDIGFTGTLKVNDASIAITANDINGAGENRWTLIGNPFPSYVSVVSLLDLAANQTALEDSREAIYVWDNNKAGGAGYSALTTGYIHPGQGFFVNSNTVSESIAINQNMLSHQSATFYKSTNTDVSINLMMTDGTITKSTEINYLTDKTTGLDPRFDLGTFTGTSTSFSVYSHLVSNSNGVNFMRQALPLDFENQIIPIGVNAAGGKEITFTAETLNLPTDIKVILEDRKANIFTRLDETNSKYTVTLTAAANGIGQFYLHTSKSALSVKDVNLSNVSVYTVNKSTLKIVGLSQGKTSVKLFNLLGKQVLNTSFKTNGVQEISLPKLASGMYIVQVENEADKLNKKIILE